MDERLQSLLAHVPKTARGEETLQKILTAAETIFAEKGYHETSIADLTGGAGISAGTFYIYFQSKYVLYKYLLTDYNKRIRRYIRQAIEGIESRREQEREGVKAWLRFVMTHSYVFNITWESLFIDKSLFDEYFSLFSAAYVKRIEAAQEAGEIVDVDPEILSFALMGINNFVALHWIVFRNEDNIDYVADQIIRLLDGIFTK